MPTVASLVTVSLSRGLDDDAKVCAHGDNETLFLGGKMYQIQFVC